MQAGDYSDHMGLVDEQVARQMKEENSLRIGDSC